MQRTRQRNGTRPKHDQRRERPHRAAESRPDPFGLRGSLPPLVTHSACIALATFGRKTANGLYYITHYEFTEERSEEVPILKSPPKQPKNESLQLRVSADFKSKLQLYAEFLHATPSYVVTEALDRIFRKDHEFRAWLEHHATIAPTNGTENQSAMEIISKS